MGHYVNNLWNAFTLASTKEEVREVFKDLFTHTEYKMVAKRLEIARRLLRNETYEAIKQQLRVTEKPIVHMSNILANGGTGLRKSDQKLTNLEKMYLARKNKRQNILEGSERRKLPGEVVLPELVKAGLKTLSKTVAKKIKQSSAKKVLSL